MVIFAIVVLVILVLIAGWLASKMSVKDVIWWL